MAAEPIKTLELHYSMIIFLLMLILLLAAMHPLHFSDYNPVAKMSYILLGYLTLHPKSVKASTVTGTLYVEDNIAAIVCEVNIYSSCAPHDILSCFF